jgi:hypothetical protein
MLPTERRQEGGYVSVLFDFQKNLENQNLSEFSVQKKSNTFSEKISEFLNFLKNLKNLKLSLTLTDFGSGIGHMPIKRGCFKLKKGYTNRGW